MGARPKAIVSWSSGKDAAWALHAARQGGEVEVVGAVTTVTSAYGRVSMHGVREALLDAQLDAVGLACRRVSIPAGCTNEVYERELAVALAAARSEGVTEVVFGDLFLADLRAWREAQLAALGLAARFPLWGRDTASLAREMIAGGARATLVCLDPKRMPRDLAGRPFDAQLLGDLPAGVDPCGENGEFHTFASDGPAFARPIPIAAGAIVERDGFVFADLLPGGCVINDR